MVIDKIGNIKNIIEPKKTGKTPGKKEVKKKDSIHISSEGKKAVEAAKYTQVVKESPDVRLEKVNDIKERIANGTYNFDDNKILEMVADRIANFLMRQ